MYKSFEEKASLSKRQIKRQSLFQLDFHVCDPWLQEQDKLKKNLKNVFSIPTMLVLLSGIYIVGKTGLVMHLSTNQ